TSFELINSLTYTRAVFREALRLFPPVARNSKVATTDSTFPDGTLVRKGDMVVWMSYVMGRHKKVWGADAEEFRPERWLEMDRLPSMFEYNVFHAGPRICLGQNMALLQGNFILAHVLRDYDVEVVNPDAITYRVSITLAMKDRLDVRIKRRKRV
ncbi:hypothetical protein HK104_003893, partial [Borealophlyctis nickersoniae]